MLVGSLEDGTYGTGDSMRADTGRRTCVGEVPTPAGREHSDTVPSMKGGRNPAVRPYI